MRISLQCEFRQQTGGVLDIYLYSAVAPPHMDPKTGEHRDDGSVEGFRRLLDALPEAQEFNLHVNSCGGDVQEGYGICAALHQHSARKTAYVDGIAASIASAICMVCDRVVMYRNSVMVIHNMSRSVCGDAAELRKAADDLDKMMEGNRQMYLRKAGSKLTEARLIEMLDQETTLTATEALACGLCDEILDSEPEPAGEARQALARMVQALHAQPAGRVFKFLGLKKEE